MNGLEAVRDRVLAAWIASPERFREDANAEEDYALGGYRDRLVVELAQNAADAATRAGVPGRLRLTLDGGVLRAANTGAPLDAAGVVALSTLRASAKRSDERSDDTVGRFGVGFAAVRAVSDTPALVSTTGAVRWSVAETRELVTAADDALAGELRARGGAVPALRLPFDWPDAPAVPDGYATEVRLPLRDSAAERLVQTLLAQVDATLLLALPALAEVVVEYDGHARSLTADRYGADVVIDDGGHPTRWRTREAAGPLDDALLADRPAEERWRPQWSVRCAVPVDADGAVRPLPDGLARVVRAPTPTDEPLTLPAVVMASLPLDPSRRHVAAGPLAEFVAAQAGACYADLAATLAETPAVLNLVPTGLAATAVDDAIRRAALDRLRELPLLPIAADSGMRQQSGRVIALDPPDSALVAALADVAPALLPAEWSRDRAALAALGIRRVDLAEIVGVLTSVTEPPRWWHELYAALAGAVSPGPARDALGSLPVPLADGRFAIGPRGLLLPEDGVLPEGLDALGVRVVDADAAHPLLRSLGAVPATAASVLEDPRAQAAVAASWELDDPDPVADAVLALVAASGATVERLPWLASLALLDDAGEWGVAGELLLPDGRLARLVGDDAPFGMVPPSLLERWGRDVLLAVGVLDGFALVTDSDVPVDPDAVDHDLDAEDEWLASVAGDDPLPALIGEFAAVRDLELVRSDAWPEALALLAEPPLRRVVVEPVRVVTASGAVRLHPSYTGWWLARHAAIGGRPLRAWAVGDLGGLYDVLPIDLDAEFAPAVGVVGSLGGADPADLLSRLGDATRAVARSTLATAHARLCGADIAPPAQVRGVDRDGAVVVVDAADAVVVDEPWLLPLVGSGVVLPVDWSLAVDLADTLDVALASECAGEVSVGSARRVAWSALPGFPLASEVVGGLPDGELWISVRVGCIDADGDVVDVRWACDEGRDYVLDGDLDALARAVAWRSGRWGERWVIRAALDPSVDAARLLLDSGR